MTVKARLSFALLALPLLAAQGIRAGGQAPVLGSAWYPEQWPESRWDADLALMQKAGMGMVRVGEFAWSSIEPSEGRFDLDWLERAVNAAGAHHLRVVIGTPTDAPPSWLTKAHPEVLRVDENGRRAEHGARRQFSYTSPAYRGYCRSVVEALARRFGRNPHVIGWQIGNEYTEESFDADTRALFDSWLQSRYGSLAELNRRWATAYWSQTYDRWEEIPIPVRGGNPGLQLDYKRFVTEEWRSFQRNQLEVIQRLADPRQAITTNLGGLGWADRFDRGAISADLDLISWDEYCARPVGTGAATRYVGLPSLDPWLEGATHDLVRGWKGRNFWVMEMQPGFVDWAPVSSCLERGATRVMAWQAVGHGADLVAFWQWRAALNGQEQYHGALAGPDGGPLPFYDEAAQIGAEFNRAAPALAGTEPVSEVAILHDYDSRWAIDFHPQSERYDTLSVLLDYYRALRPIAQSVDIVSPSARLDRYKLLLAPSLNVISDETARRLAEYVRAGGHLVLGPRSGMKDGFNALHPNRQPGALAPLLGARVEQFYALNGPVPVSGDWGTGSADIWAEYLSPRGPDSRVLMRYGKSNGWLDGQPAAVERAVGKGSIAYVGALLDEDLTRALGRSFLAEAGIAPALSAPDGVEVCRRIGPQREVFVLLNHSGHSVEFALPRPMRDVLAGRAVERVTLSRLGVAVLSSP